MTYAFPAWEFAANTHLLKLQRLQKETVSLHNRQLSGSRFVYVDDQITKSCKQRAEVYKITKKKKPLHNI
jgi:hypothetical protein